MSVTRTVLRHELKLIQKDPAIFFMIIGMPLVLMVFLAPSYDRLVGVGEGPYGDGHIVAGMTVLFAFFLANHVGISIFREHGWGTWDRVRAAHAPPMELLIGKGALPLALGLLQGVVLWLIAVPFVDVPLSATAAVQLLITHALLVTVYVVVGIALAAYLTSVQQLTASVSLLAMILGGLGGVFSATEDLPGALQVVAPVSPAYWAMRAADAAIGGESGAVLFVSWLALLIMAVALVALTGVRFRMDEQKRSWA